MSVDKLTWYAARSGGIVAWCLLAASMILGLVLSSRVLGRRGNPAWTLSVHRHLGGLGVVFTVIHVAAIMLDDFVDFGWAAVLVPFASSWRPGAVAWGIVAMYLMVAIEVTSLAMKYVPKRWWRAVHWTSAALFATATVHGFQAGTDEGRAFIIATLAVVVVLAALTAVRVVNAKRTPARPDPRDLLAKLDSRRPSRMRAERPASVLSALTRTPPEASPPTRPIRPMVGATLEAATHLDRPVAVAPAMSLADALPPVPDQLGTEGLRRPGPAPGVWKRAGTATQPRPDASDQLAAASTLTTNNPSARDVTTTTSPSKNG